MSLLRSPALANHLLARLKDDLDGGFLYFFAGEVPASAEAALDMTTKHTQLCKVSNNGTATGLTFDAPAAGVLYKAAAETWKGTNTFDGFQDTETTLTPTFYRFCPAGDTGRSAADPGTGYRLQGLIGGPSSAAELRLGTSTMTAGNEQPVGDFGWRL